MPDFLLNGGSRLQIVRQILNLLRGARFDNGQEQPRFTLKVTVNQALGVLESRDELQLDTEDEDGGRRYWIYGAQPDFHDEAGTDLAAVHQGLIAVTPVHFDLTDASGLDALEKYDLARMLAPAARDVE